MYPYLARTEFGFIYSFTAVWAVALLVTAVYLWRRETDHEYAGLLPTAVLGGLLLGRVGFVVGNWTYFQAHLDEAIRLWQGGLAAHGALWGGLFGVWAWARWKKMPPTLVWGILLPVVGGLHLAGWAACWLDGCAYGREAFLGWATADLPDSYGVFAVRYRVQAAGVLFSVVVTAVTGWWATRQPIIPPGYWFWAAVAVLQTGHAALTFWRGDTVPMIVGWRSDTIWAAVTVVAAVCLFAVGRRQSKNVMRKSKYRDKQ